MTTESARAGEARDAIDPALVAALVAIDPAGLGGTSVRGTDATAWLDALRALLPAGCALRRLPANVADARLLGGLDLAATLKAGRPIVEHGVLAEVDGGCLVLPGAERLPASTIARLTATLDSGEVRIERDGIAARTPTRFAVIALDSSDGDDAPLSAALADRLAFRLELAPPAARDVLERRGEHSASREQTARETRGRRAAIEQARARLPRVTASDVIVDALVGAAYALGIDSPRAPLLALRAARALAALGERDAVEEDDAALAAQLVLAPRATTLPQLAQDEAPPGDQPPPEPAPDADDERRDDADRQPSEDRPLDDVVIQAAAAAIPAGLLALLRSFDRSRARQSRAGRAGATRQGSTRGRPAGTRRGELRPGARINVIETLRAAAPWQPLRRAERAPGDRRRIEVRRDDFRISRYKHRTPTATIFVVDASGSSALHRLAEAKGAVELLLADCYVRRDRVALVAFRGDGAEVLLPPTRSLVRAKRSLAGLPGGGGTPLAAGITAAAALADGVRRHGETPYVVLLTDGRANIALDGTPGREQGEADALRAARVAGAAGVASLVVDTSPRPQPQARAIADALNARYLPLPHADAATLSRTVRAAAL